MDTNNPNPKINPSDNPVQLQPVSNPVYNKRRNVPIIIAAIILLLVVGSGAYYLGMNNGKSKQLSQQSNPTPTVTSNTQPTSNLSPSGQITWKTYSNTKYGYQVNYPSDKSYEEPSASGYGYTDFLLGCFRVFVVPPTFDNKELQQKTGVPWSKLNELENASIGSTNSYAVDEWKMGDDKTFTLKYDFKKLEAKQIGGVSWNAFQASNNWENHAEHNVYFTSRNNNRYLINMMSYGPCYEDEPVQMLSSFKFTN